MNKIGRRMAAQPKVYRSSKDTDSILLGVENCIESTPLTTKSFNTGPFNIGNGAWSLNRMEHMKWKPAP